MPVTRTFNLNDDSSDSNSSDDAIAKKMADCHPIPESNERRPQEQRNRRIEISDNLLIQFDQSQNDQFQTVKIWNNTKNWIILTSVRIDLISVTLSSDFNDQTLRLIKPNEIKEICLKAIFVTNKFSECAIVQFNFNALCTIERTIKIRYQVRGPVIRKELYDTPEELNNLIACRDTISPSQLQDALDRYIPSIDVDFAKHFHDLYHLEEITQRNDLKKKYNKTEVNFCESYTVCEGGKTVRKDYPPGVYDLEVKDLYETRPSLIIGDKVVARKHSELNIPYEGVITEIKTCDLICIKFTDDFSRSFDHSAYMVDFDFSRTLWVRNHFAVDLALAIFGIDYLIPKKIMERNTNLLDVRLNEMEQLEMVDGKMSKWFNNRLNLHQKRTIANILRGELMNPYLIHGPPGTGKTTTLTEIILQILTNIEHSNILISTQSNSAADLIVQHLNKYEQVNPGNLLRLISVIYANKVDDFPEGIKDYTRTVVDLLPDDQSTFYERLISTKRFRIVVGTSTAIAQLLEVKELRNHFTHAIVDEAGQSSELGVLVPMALVGRNGQTILAGDPMQMPPFVSSPHANELSMSMLSRLLNCYSQIGDSNDDIQKSYVSRLVSTLLLSYRALPSILEYYNTQFYDSKLIPTIDVEKSRQAKVLNHISENLFGRLNKSGYGIFFINVDGQDVKRINSHCNPREICVIRYLVQKLRRIGYDDKSIGVITPYSSQVRYIGASLSQESNVKVGTVDEFQGLEREIILISTVRTCPGRAAIDVSRHLGFVKCPKRINVAISRARAVVVVVGKEVLLSKDANWKALIRGCEINKTLANAIIDKCEASRTFKTRGIEFPASEL